MSSLTGFFNVFSLPHGTPETSSSLVWALNPALLVAATGMVVWLWHLARRRDLPSAHARLKRFLVSTPILAVLTLGAVFNVGTATYLGYEVPRDILQDIESAKLWLHGQPAFPLNMTDQIKDTMDREPSPLSLGRFSPTLARMEKDAYDALVKEPWAQAHPAGMTLLLALFVPWLHVRSIQLLFTLVSLASLVGTIWILRKVLGTPDSPRLLTALSLGLLGWFPFWMVIRNGQVGFFLTLLITLSWYFLRRERNVAAGICLGAATALKLFPGLLLVYLLIRRRKAFWPAALATTVFIVGSFGWMGWQNTQDYLRVTRFVQEYYKRYAANLSIRSVLAMNAQGLEDRWHASAILSPIFFLAILCLLAWTVTRKSQDKAGFLTFDLEYAMFVALMPVLSPVSWDHYLVVLALPVAVLVSSVSLRKGSLFADRGTWTAGLILVSAVLAIPRHFSNWVALSILHWNHSILLMKLPVLAVFGVFALLWGMRRHLAQATRATKSPARQGQIEAEDRFEAA